MLTLVIDPNSTIPVVLSRAPSRVTLRERKSVNDDIEMSKDS
jgi:hypothetical protein